MKQCFQTILSALASPLSRLLGYILVWLWFDSETRLTVVTITLLPILMCLLCNSFLTISVTYIPTDDTWWWPFSHKWIILTVTYFPVDGHFDGDFCWLWLTLAQHFVTNALASAFLLLFKTHNFNRVNARFLMLVHSPFISSLWFPHRKKFDNLYA